MYSLAYIRRCYPCFIILAVIGLAQFYIFVMNDPLAGYMRNTLSSFFTKESVQGSLAARKSNKNKAGPLHILLISYARTGGAFIGDLLQANPDSFYHFEPLHFFSSHVLTEKLTEAKLLLWRLFRCQSAKIPGFMNWQETYKNYMKLQRNRRYWNDCKKVNSCYNTKFLDEYCTEKKAVIIRTSRMTLREASSLYEDFPELNLKIVYLIRDPRGTVHSRSRELVRYWCDRDEACSDISRFCSILQDDLHFVCKLLRDRPDDFVLLRYEDICKEPFTHAQSLFNLLGYNNTAEVRQFLKEHTVELVEHTDDGLNYMYNTYRNSSETSTMWRQQMKYETAFGIQNTCKSVLDAHGYNSFDSRDDKRSGTYLDKELKLSITNYCSANNLM